MRNLEALDNHTGPNLSLAQFRELVDRIRAAPKNFVRLDSMVSSVDGLRRFVDDGTAKALEGVVAELRRAIADDEKIDELLKTLRDSNGVLDLARRAGIQVAERGRATASPPQSGCSLRGVEAGSEPMVMDLVSLQSVPGIRYILLKYMRRDDNNLVVHGPFRRHGEQDGAAQAGDIKQLHGMTDENAWATLQQHHHLRYGNEWGPARIVEKEVEGANLLLPQMPGPRLPPRTEEQMEEEFERVLNDEELLEDVYDGSLLELFENEEQHELLANIFGASAARQDEECHGFFSYDCARLIVTLIRRILVADSSCSVQRFRPRSSEAATRGRRRRPKAGGRASCSRHRALICIPTDATVGSDPSTQQAQAEPCACCLCSRRHPYDCDRESAASVLETCLAFGR